MLLNDTPWRAKNERDLLKRIETETIQSIISTKNISSVSKEFLVRTLKIDKSRRMTPEDLAAFSFEYSSSGNILAEKSLNATLKSPFKHEEIATLNSPSCSLRGRVERSLDKDAYARSAKPKSIPKKLANNESINLFNIENTVHLHSP